MPSYTPIGYRPILHLFVWHYNQNRMPPAAIGYAVDQRFEITSPLAEPNDKITRGYSSKFIAEICGDDTWNMPGAAQQLHHGHELNRL
jgi:hypothetical protein